MSNTTDTIESEKKTSGFLFILKRFFRSFAFRIFVYLMIFAIIPATIMNILDNYYFGNIISETETESVGMQAAVIANEMKNYESLEEASKAGQFSVYTNFASINEIRIRILDNNYRIVLETYGFDTGKTMINESAVKAMESGAGVTTYVRDDTIVESASVLTNNKGDTIGIVLMGQNMSKVNASISDVHRYSTLITVSVILSLAVVAGFLAFKFSNKYRAVKESVDDIAAGKTDNRLNVNGYTEYQDFSIRFNDILDNAGELNKSREEFVSNVSHELKTPMTSIKLLADSLLANPDTPVEVYKEFMQDIANEIDRENGIIEDLLSLVRMDNSVANLKLAFVNINELIEKVMRKLTPIADRKSIELVFECIRHVEAEIDEIKITQVATNLIENAIKYNREHGFVHVSLNADYEFFYLRVEDNGFGIPEEDQKNVFQRFYRVDKARSRETGGTGLGLSIVKTIVLMHDGQIKLYSEPESENGEEGTTVFTVKIPLKSKNSQRQGVSNEN